MNLNEEVELNMEHEPLLSQQKTIASSAEQVHHTPALTEVDKEIQVEQHSIKGA